MSNIPEHIIAEARRLAAEGMPLEQIAFFTRIDAEVIAAELKEQKDENDHPPAEHTEE